MPRVLPALPDLRGMRLHLASHGLRALLTLLFAALWMPVAAPVHADAFVVHPTRLELGGARVSGVLTVRNEGAVPQAFQVKGMRWTQDDEGQDHYADTTDLIYFPRLLTVPPGQSAVIRLGVREAPGPLERTYRLFIEQMPAPGLPDDGSPLQAPSTASHASRIRVLVRFGAPVFVAPLALRHGLSVSGFALERGQARWTLRNEGSRHEVLRAITLRALDAAGAEVHTQAYTGHYLLAGAVRHLRVSLPADACPRVSRVVVEVQAEPTPVTRQFEAGAMACLPRATPADPPG